ncbi:polysaccharide deacetylase family protein [Vibrio maerlii]|uniref:polysaccharide deacetylase family protein n=1 Tax=Vibrio maerlii TaxID=2231648 RepID=UPI000E3DCB39|nr:polysaccharide deacetylase family protein [Vibrio maerlii]
MKIALTFEGGINSITNELLDLLNNYQAKATFFCLASHVEENPDITRRIVQEGHLIGGNHYQYLDSVFLDFSEFIEQLIRCNSILEKVTGQMVRYYMPPYGSVSNEQQYFLTDSGLTTVYWNIDSENNGEHKVENIVGNIMTNVREESVILCHQRGILPCRNTLRALRIVIPMLKQCGYQFVSVDKINSGKANQLVGAPRGAIVEK